MDEGTRFLILSLMGETYALPITRLLEITVPRGIQKDANLSDEYEGKFAFRGKWVPAVNLKKLFKVPGVAGSTLLVIRSGTGVVGLLVDAVTEILDADKPPVPMPKGVMSPTLNVYSGVVRHRDNVVLLLNGDGLLP